MLVNHASISVRVLVLNAPPDWYVAIVASNRTVSFSVLRQLEWCFTTPIMLMLVQNIHAYAFAGTEAFITLAHPLFLE